MIYISIQGSSKKSDSKLLDVNFIIDNDDSFSLQPLFLTFNSTQRIREAESSICTNNSMQIAHFGVRVSFQGNLDSTDRHYSICNHISEFLKTSNFTFRYQFYSLVKFQKDKLYPKTPTIYSFISKFPQYLCVYQKQLKKNRNIIRLIISLPRQTKMNTKGAMNEHIQKYTRQIHDLLVIIISDNEGVHIYNASHESVKDKIEKIVQTSTMLISTINQCEGNYQKISRSKIVNPITYYYDQFLIHFRKNKHFNVTLFMRPKASGLFAEEISAELVQTFAFLNTMLAKKD